jgi:hypothetical protein
MSSIRNESEAESESLLLMHHYAEHLFLELFRRLHAQVVEHKVSMVSAIHVAREISHDEVYLADLQREGQSLEQLVSVEFSDMRTASFKRFVMHQFLQHATLDIQLVENHRYWLLHFIEIIETALGQYRFDESQRVCDALFEQEKDNRHFRYRYFLTHDAPMMEYIFLMMHLAVFLENNPKHRINWLFKSMESSPTTRVEKGVSIHVSSSLSPPTERNVAQFLLGIFEHLLSDITAKNLVAFIHQKIPQLATEPDALLKQLMEDIKLLHPTL